MRRRHRGNRCNLHIGGPLLRHFGAEKQRPAGGPQLRKSGGPELRKSGGPQPRKLGGPQPRKSCNQPPPVGQPAAVIEVGKHGRAWSVDGAETPSFANTIRLAPGEHRVGINCLSFEVGAIGIVAGGPRAPATAATNFQTTLQSVLMTGPFEEGKTYYTRCVAVNGQPRAWLTDTPAGTDLPQGFTSICTRECPR